MLDKGYSELSIIQNVQNTIHYRWGTNSAFEDISKTRPWM